MVEVNLTAVKDDLEPKSMLATWKSWGISSVTRYGAYMQGMGGSALSVPAVKAWVDAATPLGMRVGQKLNLDNYNIPPLLAEWFDNTTWDVTIYPAFIERFQAGNAAGVSHYHIDGEEYNTNAGNGIYSGEGAYWYFRPTAAGTYTGKTPYRGTWPAYAHDSASQAYVAFLRGARVGQLAAQYDPGKDVTVYYAKFPGDWNDLLQQRVNGAPPSDGGTMAQFFAGWLANSDAPHFTFINYGGVKNTQGTAGGFGGIIDQDRNAEVWLANRLGTGWPAAKARLRWSAAVAICPDAPDNTINSPAYVQSQLAAFAADTNYVQLYEQQLDTFDYTPYIPVIQATAAIGQATTSVSVSVTDKAGHITTQPVTINTT